MVKLCRNQNEFKRGRRHHILWPNVNLHERVSLGRQGREFHIQKGNSKQNVTRFIGNITHIKQLQF